MAAKHVPNVELNHEFDEEDIALRRVMEVFLKPDKELLEHPKCISSSLGYLDNQFVQNTIQHLQPQMLLEKERTVIVAFNKNKKSQTEAEVRNERELSQSSYLPRTKATETSNSCSTSTASASSGIRSQNQ